MPPDRSGCRAPRLDRTRPSARCLEHGDLPHRAPRCPRAGLRRARARTRQDLLGAGRRLGARDARRGRDGRRQAPGRDRLRHDAGLASPSASTATAASSARTGCADQNRNSRYESWSMAKSVTALIFGRAMTLGLISPDDPVGSLVPEADKAHGEITVHDLLTMTSGLKWNGVRDYNIFTMPDRVRDALTLERRQAARHLLRVRPEPGRAARRDGRPRRPARTSMAFVQRELMTPLGIEEGTWDWARDKAGHVQGFYGVQHDARRLRPARRPMRRGGVWKGKRLLSQGVRQALDRAVEDERLLRLADLAERRGAVHRPDGRGPRGRGRPRLPRAARRLLQLLRAVRAARDGLPDAGHRRSSASARTPASCPPARPAGSTSCTSACSRSITDQNSSRPATRRA